MSEEEEFELDNEDSEEVSDKVKRIRTFQIVFVILAVVWVVLLVYFNIMVGIAYIVLIGAVKQIFFPKVQSTMHQRRQMNRSSRRDYDEE